MRCTCRTGSDHTIRLEAITLQSIIELRTESPSSYNTTSNSTDVDLRGEVCRKVVGVAGRGYR